MTESERDTICAALDNAIDAQRETRRLLDEISARLAELVLELDAPEGPPN